MLRAFFDDRVPGHRRLSHVFWIDGVVISHILFVALLAVYETLPAAAFLERRPCGLGNDGPRADHRLDDQLGHGLRVPRAGPTRRPALAVPRLIIASS